jgi:hypothetical protein
MGCEHSWKAKISSKHIACTYGGVMQMEKIRWMEKHIRLLGNEVYHSWINNTHRVHLCTYVLKQEKDETKR